MNKRIKNVLGGIYLIGCAIILIASFFGYTSYQISWDEHYVNSVYERALVQGYSPDKVTDFSEGSVASIDATGRYETKVWKLQHKELYYLEGFRPLMNIIKSPTNLRAEITIVGN